MSKSTSFYTRVSRTIACAILWAAGSGAYAAEIVINFDDILEYRVPVTNQYAGLGVTFKNALTGSTRVSILPPLCVYPGGSCPTTLISDEPAHNGYQPQPARPIIAQFAFEAISVSINALGLGTNGATLSA